MEQSLNNLHREIKQAAIDKGLIVVDDLPGLSRFPSLIWKGEWKEYLDCALQVHTTLLYLKKWIYDPEILVKEVVDEQENYYSRDKTNDNENQDAESVVAGSPKWLQTRLEEAITPWSKYRSEVFSVSSVWLKEGVAHLWSCDAEWYSEYSAALETALEEAGEVEEEQRELVSKEAALKFYDYAAQLAHHPRFPEATSAAKREYMASQLFPELKDIFPEYNAAARIVERATLIYWWEVESVEKVERARQMYASGETMQNIAAVLKMSDKKVREAIRGTPET